MSNLHSKISRRWSRTSCQIPSEFEAWCRTRKYQFMEQNQQRRAAGLKDKMPDIQKTLDTVRFLKTRKVRLLTYRKMGGKANITYLAWLGSNWSNVWIEWYALCKSTCASNAGGLSMARGKMCRKGNNLENTEIRFRPTLCCHILLTRRKSYLLPSLPQRSRTFRTAKKTWTFSENKLRYIFPDSHQRRVANFVVDNGGSHGACLQLGCHDEAEREERARHSRRAGEERIS